MTTFLYLTGIGMGAYGFYLIVDGAANLVRSLTPTL